MHITHCDIFEGSRRSVCACTGAEVTVKQWQLSSRVKGDRRQDSYLLFLKMNPCLVGDTLKGSWREPSERQVESI